VKAYRSERQRAARLRAWRAQPVSQHRHDDDRISGVGAFAQLVIGAISVVLILIGGRAVLAAIDDAGAVRPVRLLRRPRGAALINIASIGTQITEAFAGLDGSTSCCRMRPRTLKKRNARRWPVRGDVACST